MDRLKRTADMIKAYYGYKRSGDSAGFVKEVCRFFDYVKDKSISESDLNFLIFLANEAGIPQYYDLLMGKFTNTEMSEENVNSLTLSAFIHDASLIRGNSKLHRYQNNVLNVFREGQKNRFVLTAPTSFGKTFLVYEILKKMQYRNILLIFPAISLLSENYVRLCNSDAFKEYKIYTLSEEDFDSDEKNIFVFTPERFLSFMDSHLHIHFDFAFIDEIYKIDNSFIIDQENVGENERDTAYRLALEFVCHLTDDMLLAGPYISLPESNEKQKRSFNDFANDNGFSFLRYNQFEIVLKQYITIKGRQEYDIDNISVKIGSISKAKKISNIVYALSTPSENTIIYCGRKSDTVLYAKALLNNPLLITSFHERCAEIDSPVYEIFLEHLENTFGEDWIVLKALRVRVGIHHSLIPKYIQKEIINLFNSGVLLCLFSTTTITEGVNTSAKNIIIASGKKGAKPLRQFDAKNIAGRAGRFQQHYSGRVIDLNNGFEEVIRDLPDMLEHKNYDLQTSKTDIDYQITKDKYLSEKERNDKILLYEEIQKTGIPLDVFNKFRVVGPKDKLILYTNIKKMPWWIIDEVKRTSIYLAQSRARRLYWNGFQLVMDLIFPIVHEEKLRQLISVRTGEQKKYSLVTVLLNHYLDDGFISMVRYYTTRDKEPKNKDEAIQIVADFVYNVFKYHLVKYLGLFDIFYRYHISKIENIDMDDVAGLGLLIQKLEYNALTPSARKISDYGVPFKLIDYYDNEVDYNKKSFDAYELYIDGQIREFFS